MPLSRLQALSIQIVQNEAADPSTGNHLMGDSVPEEQEKMSSNGVSQPEFIGAIDQGTTSSRFLIFNKEGEPVCSHQIEFKQYYPESGYVYYSNLC